MRLKRLFGKSTYKNKHKVPKGSRFETVEPIAMYSTLEDNKTFIEGIFSETDDLGIREIYFNNRRCFILFLETLGDIERIQVEIINPIQQVQGRSFEEVLAAPLYNKTSDLNKCIQNMLQGYCAILLEDEAHIYLVKVIEKIHRNIDEPKSESIIRGSHEGFIEDLSINLNIMRKRIENPDLTIKYHTVGGQSKTQIALMYMKNIADPDNLKELEKRIKAITIDTIISPGVIEELIENHPFSLFPQLLSTERPDRIEAQLMEGRMVIFCEGSPTSIVTPVTFFSFYQSPDDYNERWWMGTFYRLLRITGFFIAICLPAFYISVVSFHFEIIPPLLTFQVKSDVENIPFPPLVEAFILELTIELIREAAIRLPRAVGQTIGIVGGLVIGEAIVKAGLVSNLMIIVVALTALSSYIIPSNEMSSSVRLIRFPLMIAAATLGFLGIVFSLMFLLIHLCKLHSLHTPYFAPLAPLRIKDLKDTFVRLPMWKLNSRPLDDHPQILKAQGKNREWQNDDRSK